MEVRSRFWWRPRILEIFAPHNLTSSTDASIIRTPHITSQVRAYVPAWTLRTTNQKSSTGLPHVSMCRVQTYISSSLQRILLAVPLANFNRAFHSLTKADARSKSLKNLRAKLWPEVTIWMPFESMELGYTHQERRPNCPRQVTTHWCLNKNDLTYSPLSFLHQATVNATATWRDGL